ncbi:MarR family winged helix-turn-helix transcriptional regulator [Hyphococcus sp.]|uniref:MarR family winged helix-turn-helix transcriptional regulator n=1 Tax=Hyphococcus sp. TaxID=2038636 RepID=UPI00208445B0|nr:MAG: transcriptional regulator [Marinicaulis sp.]
MTVVTVMPNPLADKKRKLVLEEFAPYRIVALGHAISGRLARAYRDEKITIPEWRVLAVIGEAAQVAARDVVRRTPMDKMTVSRAVASLEQKGFVKRAPDPDDRRVSSLALSGEGRALFDRVAAMALEFEDDLLATLGADEAAAFRMALKKLEARAMENGD